MRNQAKGDGTIDTDTLPTSRRDEDQAERDASSRRKALAELLAFVNESDLDVVDLVELANVLQLDLELEELAARHPKRHRRSARVQAARDQLGIQLDELEPPPVKPR